MKYIYSIILICSLAANVYLYQHIQSLNYWSEAQVVDALNNEIVPESCSDMVSDLLYDYAMDNPAPKLPF